MDGFGAIIVQGGGTLLCNLHANGLCEAVEWRDTLKRGFHEDLGDIPNLCAVLGLRWRDQMEPLS